MATQDNKELKKAMDEVGEVYIKDLAKELVKDGKKNTGSLINSLSYKVVKTIDGYMTEIIANDYLDEVDQGRKKGKQPPADKIAKWAAKRGIRVQGTTAKQTGFIIAKSIAKKGIKPTNVIEKAKKKAINNITKILTEAAAEDIENLIDKEFKDI